MSRKGIPIRRSFDAPARTGRLVHFGREETPQDREGFRRFFRSRGLDVLRAEDRPLGRLRAGNEGSLS